MTAVHPLPDPIDDDMDVRPLDLDECAPEERAAIEAALERIASGTARLVSHAEVVADLERQRQLAEG